MLMLLRLLEAGEDSKGHLVTHNGRSVRPEFLHLACGQGRLEAFLASGETLIPAVIIKASKEDR
jgi:hypothetical protein